jgi:hypothetical protein
MMDEKEIFDKTEDIIQNTFDDGFNIDNNTKITGKRILKNGHKTMYIIYNGTNISKNPNENIKIIGEVWNCGKSSTSIICLGYAQITDNKNNNANIYINYWQKIIGDEQGTFGLKDFQKEDGLIFNVICH